MSNEELKQNLTSTNQWVRLIYMVLFAVLLEIAGFVMLAVVIAQFIFAIFTGSANDNLRRLGDQLASYIYQALQFLIYNSEEKPFPFSEWPESDVDDISSYESAEEFDGEVISEDEVVEGESEGATAEEAEEAEEASVIELGAEDVKEEPAKSRGAADAEKPRDKTSKTTGGSNKNAESDGENPAEKSTDEK
ncbi:DUF4389 domain-containing protein [uncultured Microbulbifer sp.]|uniref:DUF4389 domain-containing protein n=1 Tax=uncultured Microbulbifer sp. TaxID=348147 RepID=UPI0025E0102A|nr:DUF4389 domain-containing protein [uncultured Microbulbifer sp.]